MKKILLILIIWTTTAQAQKITLTQVRSEIATANAALKKANTDTAARVRRDLVAALARLDAANKKALADSFNKLPPLAFNITPAGVVDGVNKVFRLGRVDSASVKVWASDDGKRYYLLRRYDANGAATYTVYNTGRLVMKEAPKFPLLVDFMQ